MYLEWFFSETPRIILSFPWVISARDTRPAPSALPFRKSVISIEAPLWRFAMLTNTQPRRSVFRSTSRAVCMRVYVLFEGTRGTRRHAPAHSPTRVLCPLSPLHSVSGPLFPPSFPARRRRCSILVHRSTIFEVWSTGPWTKMIGSYSSRDIILSDNGRTAIRSKFGLKWRGRVLANPKTIGRRYKIRSEVSKALGHFTFTFEPFKCTPFPYTADRIAHCVIVNMKFKI